EGGGVGGRGRVDAEAGGGGGAASSPGRVIFHIWPDFEVRALLTHSVSTVKADAALTAFTASGSRIVWAVLDSGVQGDHPHFRKHNTLLLDAPLAHIDFTAPPGAAGTPLVGHLCPGTPRARVI